MLKFIYFDVGGVVINDFSNNNGWDDLKDSIGLTPIQFKQFDDLWAIYADKVCTTLDVDSLLPVIADKFSLNFSKDYSLLSEFVKGFSRNSIIEPTLKRISNKLPVGLLTNMYPRMFDEINSAGIMPQINWEVIVDSSIVGYEKPNFEIYKHSEEVSGRSGGEILFIDNSREHLEGAKKLGWKTYFFDVNQPLESSQSLELFVDELLSEK